MSDAADSSITSLPYYDELLGKAVELAITSLEFMNANPWIVDIQTADSKRELVSLLRFTPDGLLVNIDMLSLRDRCGS